MNIILNNIIITLKEDESVLINKITRMLNIPRDFVDSFVIIKKAVDARKKNNILFTYSCLVTLNCKRDFSGNTNVKNVDFVEDLEIPKLHSEKRPIIVGFGPAGMMAGLYLARAGLNPIIIERGKKVSERIEDVKLFKEKGIFNKESNVCFGEGGAGTFSDGKLTTGINDYRIRFVLSEFIKHGAPKEIYYEAHPHIGSDYLRNVVQSIREEIIALGGTVLFEHTFVNFTEEKGRIKSIDVLKKDGSIETFYTDDLIIAIGHSARDTFEMLHKNNLHMEPKPFSVGVRVEMKQEKLNKDQYGEECKNPKLKPAEYKVSEHLPTGRSIYSFCMCPGGEVVASNTEEDSILVNGMSYFKRDLENANSALLVSVNVEDYYNDSPLDGCAFQEEIEKKAYNKNYPYCAPVQLVGDFLKHKKTTKFGSVKPSYRPGTYFAEMDDILPEFVCKTMREGIPKLSNKLHTLKEYDNVLTGVETRSSSPIKIPRDENGESSVKGIYPCGEGASYAGGIMSAAIDGLKIAEKLLNAASHKLR